MHDSCGTCDGCANDATAKDCEAVSMSYYTDGSSKSWDWMNRSCEEKGKRLCTYEEICPYATQGSDPLGGQQASSDMWVPVHSSHKDWVQVGTRDGGMCNLLLL